LSDLRQKEYRPELDGIRALAILLVLISHIRPIEGGPPIGYLGVGIFFVLSGYLITSISLAEEAKKGALSLAGFYIRRTFRIFPLYYFVLGTYCFLILGLNLFPEKHLPLKEALPFYLAYLQEIPFFRAAQGGALPFYQSWSLGIEEKFYLIWPLVCFVALRHRSAWRIPAGFVLVMACSFNRYTRPYVSILFGCLLALSLQCDSVRKTVERNAAAGIWILTALLVSLCFAPALLWKWDLALSLYALVFAFFLGFLVTGKSYFKKVLGLPPLAFVGKMSYGVYLVHLLCIGLLRSKAHIHTTWIMMFAALGLSLAVAVVLHYLLEQPFIQWGRHLSKKAMNPESSAMVTAIDSRP
jgi:peptidoglycan/LPS O-acetylase OafA/YrhL